MLIDTQSHFKRFYHQHQTTIDTLLLMAQLLATAIAVMVLISLLGWAAAISYASDWCDRLVESSLSSTSPQTATVVEESMPKKYDQPEAIAAKTEIPADAVPASTLEAEIPALPTEKNNTFKNIRKQAARNQKSLQSVLS